jgi:hypothetical protein
MTVFWKVFGCREYITECRGLFVPVSLRLYICIAISFATVGDVSAVTELPTSGFLVSSSHRAR